MRNVGEVLLSLVFCHQQCQQQPRYKTRVQRAGTTMATTEATMAHLIALRCAKHSIPSNSSKHHRRLQIHNASKLYSERYRHDSQDSCAHEVEPSTIRPTRTSSTMTANNDTADSVFEAFDSKKNPPNPTASEDYDPFGVGKPTSPSEASPLKRQTTAPLPPKVAIKFIVHEDVSSTAITGTADEGASEVFANGTIQCQINSSDALKNAPFQIILRSKAPQSQQPQQPQQEPSAITFVPSPAYSKIEKAGQQQRGSKSQNVVKISKSMISFVPVGAYQIKEKIVHMPLLLERKIDRKGSAIQIAVQVRSKMDNSSDLTHIRITASIAPSVLGSSITMVSGNGEFDKMKRTISWKLDRLPKGESFMVSAKARVQEDVPTTPKEFPVMLRCSAQDQISTVSLQAAKLPNHPASIASQLQSRSFLLVHHLK